MSEITQADLEAAVAAATAPLQAQIAELTAAQAGSAVEAAVAEAVAPLQTQLDQVETRAAAAEARVAELEAEATAAAEAAEAAEAERIEVEALAAVKAARVAVLAASVEDGGLGWTAERVEARADHYAGLPEDAWLVQLEDLRAQASSVSKIDPPDVDKPLAGASVVGGTTTPAGAAPAQAAGEESLAHTVLSNRGRIRDLAL